MIQRKPGRPKAIPAELEEFVMTLYKNGFGYRSIARKLEIKGLVADWTTVRRVIKQKHSDKNDSFYHYLTTT